jgi:ribosome-binding factor A
MATQRQEKVNHALKVEISDILLRELKDPRMGFVTITDAEVSADMRYAKVYFTVLGSEHDRKINTEMLRHSAGFIRAELGNRLKMRNVPVLDFRYDESVEKGIKMHELLTKLGKEEDERAEKYGKEDK